jgi:hypothetical protein
MTYNATQSMVDRLLSRYELDRLERVAMAQLIQRLVKENQTLKDRLSDLSWQLDVDRQDGL